MFASCCVRWVANRARASDNPKDGAKSRGWDQHAVRRGMRLQVSIIFTYSNAGSRYLVLSSCRADGGQVAMILEVQIAIQRVAMQHRR
jgi:hypothetical protein